VRYRNAIDPRAYVEATKAVRDDVVGEGDRLSISSETLDASALLRERIMLGLRLATGVDLGRAQRDLGIDPWTEERTRTVAELVGRDRLARDGDVLRIPKPAWLFTDDTAARLF
jgi:oxygen-independent coproporphyrinogen-3 oxidase